MDKRNFLDIISKAKTFLILTHVRPDGDAVASSIAMHEFLVSLGKNSEDIEVYIPHISKDLSFIDKDNIIVDNCTKQHDLAIIVDVSDFLRIEGSGLLKEFSPQQCILFDHHERTGEPIETKYSFVDTSASSCTCVIHRELSMYIDMCSIKSFARCIAIGILSDTIGLKQNVTEECEVILNFCKSNGVDDQSIMEQLNNTDLRTQMLTDVAVGRLFFDRGIGCTYILQTDLMQEERDLKTLNHKVIIQKILETNNCETLILLIENDNNEVKGSMRTSVSTLDLNAICNYMVERKYFVQGGGHSNSAGFRMAISDSTIKSLNNIFKLLISTILNS